MALLRCSKCSQVVSSHAEICPHCGEQISNSGENKTFTCPECASELPVNTETCPQCGYPINPKDVSSKTVCMLKKIFSSKRAMLFVAVAIFVVVTIIFVMSYGANKLSSTEEYAVARVEKLIDMLKDPDSIILRNDVLVVYADDEKDGLNHYTYITYSANNSYGASIQSTSIFKNSTYIGDTSDDVEDFDTLEEKLSFAKAKLYLASWNLVGAGSTDFLSAEMVSKEKIGRHLDIDYTK